MGKLHEGKNGRIAKWTLWRAAFLPLSIHNEINTPWTDQRFGGVILPFEVKSGTFQNWEIIPAGVYVYDPLVDTLELDLQGDVTVIANFIPASRFNLFFTGNLISDIIPKRLK